MSPAAEVLRANQKVSQALRTIEASDLL